MTNSCLFCSLIQKEKPSYIIYEDDAVFAFLDIFPRVVGHTIVVPKRHMETVLEMKSEEIKDFWLGVNTVLELLQKVIKPQGFTIGVNHGKVSGQEIEHLHVHLMPRFEGDGGGSMQSVIDTPQLTKTVAEVYEEIQQLSSEKL